MMPRLIRIRNALAAGSERVNVWSDLLDDINVFPVADGDTGRNLAISLASLHERQCDLAELADRLLLSAKGCSGHIATRFFSGFLVKAERPSLREAIQYGNSLAWEAVADPRAGTMLSVFRTLAEVIDIANETIDVAAVDRIVEQLEKEVLATRESLPELSGAGLVDSGALAMFVFWEGFFQSWLGRETEFRPINERFAGLLTPLPRFHAQESAGYCIDAVLRTKDAKVPESLPAMGESVVAVAQGEFVKIHLHANNREEAKRQLDAVASVVSFNADDLGAQTREFHRPTLRRAIHVMTDAAGSATRADAKQLGLTLLDSYVMFGRQCVPETRLDPAELYAAMRQGVRASTAQASPMERHQHYAKALSLSPRVLYVCVGSVFTGNYQVAMEWKKKHDRNDCFTVIDSGAASGRLGLVALVAAQKALTTESANDVIDFAKRAVSAAQEYIFLDELKYLAAGGRISKASAFLGDLVRLKPIISPEPDGARKVGAVRNRREQLEFALARMREQGAGKAPALWMLEYSDNRLWLVEEVLPKIRESFGELKVQVQPLSLTTGVHTGPGSWGIAYLPALD